LVIELSHYKSFYRKGIKKCLGQSFGDKLATVFTTMLSFVTLQLKNLNW